MAGKDRSAPPWLAPLLSVVLAAAAFALARLYGWPWGAFLLAEVLALMALTAALWRTGEGHPWWLYPALFVALVILIFSWLYLSGRLDLAGAVQAGSAVVLAFFTITLWRSTQTQAEATNEMRRLQERFSRAELTPLVVVKSASLVSFAELSQQSPELREIGEVFAMELFEKECFLIVRLLNAGKYPVVKLEASVLLGNGRESVCRRVPPEIERALSKLYSYSEEEVWPQVLFPGKVGAFIFFCGRGDIEKRVRTEVVLTWKFVYGGEPGRQQDTKWRAYAEPKGHCPKLLDFKEF